MSEKSRDSFWVWFVIVLVALGIPFLLIWGLWGGNMHGMMNARGYTWGFMPLIAVASLMLIVLGSYCLITALGWHTGPESKHTGSASEILKERYARGEITREQYLKMKEELES